MLVHSTNDARKIHVRQGRRTRLIYSFILLQWGAKRARAMRQHLDRQPVVGRMGGRQEASSLIRTYIIPMPSQTMAASEVSSSY
jgi:hypothetical protein